MKKSCYLILLLLSIGIQSYSQNIEQEIINIKSPEEINQYLLNIKSLDQSNRRLNSVDSIDNLNFKKIILLIKNHGYPKGSMIPNLIATHQRSLYVNEYYLPVFYNAYKTGQSDTTWFYHVLRGVHRGQFGRDFVRNRGIMDSDVDTMMKRLSPYLNKKANLSIEKFDSLYKKYISDLHNITSSQVIYNWKNNENDSYFIYKYKEKLFYYKLYSDGSSRLPQEIRYNKTSRRYEYINVIKNDYLLIKEDSTLQVFLNDELKEEVQLKK